MVILPAIDLYESRAVRLTRGDYEKMTVYSENPTEVACGFRAAGASEIHVVDLEGAKNGTTANFDTVRRITEQSGLSVEVGGGIRTAEVVEKYLSLGVNRVILGTAALTKPEFLKEMVRNFDSRIAVSVDIKDGYAATHGWTETSDKDGFAFCRVLEDMGVKTIICTDISKDGVLGGTNMSLYEKLSAELSINIIASGGVTEINEVRKLDDMKIYGVILGKSLYTGAIRLEDAVAAAGGNF